MQNDDRVLSFINGTPSKRFLAVRLQARHGNPTALGASVVVRFKDGSRQRMDVHGGSGYLSQSSPECYFGLGEGVPLGVDVRWPDGTATQHPITSMSLRLLQP